MAEFALIFVVALGAAFLQRVAGFGFGIMFMSVMPFFAPSYAEALTLSGTLALICATVSGIRYRKWLCWRKLVVILPFFLVTSFFAGSVVTKVDSMILKRILGGALLLAGLFFILTDGKMKVNCSVPMQAFLGTLSGITGGLFGIQGPPAVIYFLSCTDRKEEYVALAQWYFICANISMTLYRIREGFFTTYVATGWLAGVCAVLLGLWLGSFVYGKVPMQFLRKGIYIFIALIGLAVLIGLR